MSVPCQFSYHFYAVGQGLFSTGSIHKTGEHSPQFLWVDDCGRSYPQLLIDGAIDALKERVENQSRIELLTLSHFDLVHISGVCGDLGSGLPLAFAH